LEDCPPPDEDFGEWLKFQKTSWRRIRKNFKEDKKVIKDQAGDKSKKHQSLVSFIRNMDDVVLKSTWHIVQISDETFEPGVLRLWALTEQGQMFSIRLRVPRTIYINSKVVAKDEPAFKKVNKLLPRNRRVYHLYEWEREEEAFQAKFHDLSYRHLLNYNVEGVYETKMPLLFRAVMDLGCLVKPNYQAIPRSEQALGRTYKLSELDVKSAH
jgi:DNA polymerase epsilon subunit 1